MNVCMYVFTIICNIVPFLFAFFPLLAIRCLPLSFHPLSSFLELARIWLSYMFVWVTRKSRASGLWGFFFFVVDGGGRGYIERPMAWCISLIPKKLKNENPKKKKFENQKIKIWKRGKITFVAISLSVLSLKFSI